LEVTADTRRQIIKKKVKLGWIMCNLGDYLVANRCYKCSKFNHRSRECRGIVTCPLCAENHSMKECTATPEHYKCINCHNFNTYNKHNTISDNHSSLGTALAYKPSWKNTNKIQLLRWESRIQISQLTQHRHQVLANQLATLQACKQQT